MAKSVTVNGFTYSISPKNCTKKQLDIDLPFFFSVGWGSGMSSHGKGPQEKREHEKHEYFQAMLLPTVGSANDA